MRLIALINGSTRLGVITWLAGGDYPPGQYGNQDSRVWKERHELSA